MLQITDRAVYQCSGRGLVYDLKTGAVVLYTVTVYVSPPEALYFCSEFDVWQRFLREEELHLLHSRQMFWTIARKLPDFF